MVFEGFITLTSVWYQNVTRIYSWVHIKATFNFTVPFSCVIYGDGCIFQLFEQFCRLTPLKQLTCQILYLKSNSITSIVLWRLIELCWIYALWNCTYCAYCLFAQLFLMETNVQRQEHTNFSEILRNFCHLEVDNLWGIITRDDPMYIHHHHIYPTAFPSHLPCVIEYDIA